MYGAAILSSNNVIILDAEAAFKRLSEAYECLVDEVSQRCYMQQLQVHESKTRAQSTNAQKNRQKRKRKSKAKSKSEGSGGLPARRRTPEEIWQAFQREEEELARQLFQTREFDRMYKPRTTQSADAGTTSAVPLEEPQHILNSSLEEKAANWATWSKSSSRRTKRSWSQR